MTIAICRAFDVFAELPLSNTAALVLSNITSSLWLAMGEGDLWVLCCHAYHVANKEMVWFDKMDPMSLQTYFWFGRHRCRLCMTKEKQMCTGGIESGGDGAVKQDFQGRPPTGTYSSREIPVDSQAEDAGRLSLDSSHSRRAFSSSPSTTLGSGPLNS
jgi:hypothetical protein